MFEIRYTSAVRPDGQRSSRRRVPLRPSESNRNQKAWMNSLRRRPVSGAVPQRWIDVRLAIPPAASNKIKLSGQQYLCKNTNSKLYRSVLFFFCRARNAHLPTTCRTACDACKKYQNNRIHADAAAIMLPPAASVGNRSVLRLHVCPIWSLPDRNQFCLWSLSSDHKCIVSIMS